MMIDPLEHPRGQPRLTAARYADGFEHPQRRGPALADVVAVAVIATVLVHGVRLHTDPFVPPDLHRALQEILEQPPRLTAEISPERLAVLDPGPTLRHPEAIRT